MNLKGFRQRYNENDNIFWTLESGEIQNLLDEAIEIIEEYENKEFTPIVAHVVIKNKGAEAALEKACNGYGNDVYIDYIPTLSSYEAKLK